MFRPADGPEKTGPRLMTRDPLFHSNKVNVGQEELGYLKSGRTRDIVEVIAKGS